LAEKWEVIYVYRRGAINPLCPLGLIAAESKGEGSFISAARGSEVLLTGVNRIHTINNSGRAQ